MSEEELLKEQKKIKDEEEKVEQAKQAKIEEARNLIMQMKIVGSTDMPKPLDPGTVCKGTVTLQTNLFGIRMDEDYRIYKYDVEMYADIGQGERAKTVEFTKKGRSDYMVVDRKRQCMAVFEKGIKAATFYRDDITFFYDGQSLMYSKDKLVFNDPTKPNETIIVEGPSVSKDLETFPHITMVIKECKEKNGVETYLSDIRKLHRDISKQDRSAMQYVDVVTSSYALSQTDRFTVFANGKMFPNRPDLERIQTVKMKEGKELIPGMSKSIRLIEGPRGRNNASSALAIDSLKVAFHVKEKVIDKCMGIFPHINNMTRADIDSFSAMVRGIGCMTLHMQKNMRVEIHQISKENSSMMLQIDLPAEMSRQMSVCEYFKWKWRMDLKYPNAPLVMSRVRNKINVYPMEVLEIMPMQRVTIPQTTPAQSQVATKECAVPPGVRQNAIMDQCKLHDLFNPEMQFLKAAGLTVLPTPLQVTARLLKGPVLQYKSSELEVITPSWKPPQSYQYAVAASLDKWSMYAVLGPRDVFTQADLHKFAEAFVKRAKERGMKMVPPTTVEILPNPPADKSADFPAREKIKEAAFNKVKFLFFITSDFITIHKHVKLQETYSCVITQDLKLKTAQNFLQKGQSQTMDNIVAKTNVKLGGMDYGMSLKNIVGPTFNPFPPSRLILGIGVSHAPFCPTYFTPTGVKLASPSAVGYSANMATHPTEFIGDFLYQDAKKEDVLNCTVEMLQNVLDRFTGKVTRDGKREEKGVRPFPREIIIYRQGVAEGFYAMVLAEEIPLVRAVLASNGVSEVKITYIIVTKEHGVRLMPVDIDVGEKATVQNIGVGAVLDSQITHPRYREFYINSHTTLQGTARTPRYTVLHDDGDISMNQLESLTHALAFNFQIVNSPVSIPAPLYIANRYAERGVAVFLAKSTDELATSDQKIRTSIAQMNEDLTYKRKTLGGVRINA